MGLTHLRNNSSQDRFVITRSLHSGSFPTIIHQLFPKFPDRAIVLALIYCLVHPLLKQFSKIFTRVI